MYNSNFIHKSGIMPLPHVTPDYTPALICQLHVTAQWGQWCSPAVTRGYTTVHCLSQGCSQLIHVVMLRHVKWNNWWTWMTQTTAAEPAACTDLSHAACRVQCWQPAQTTCATASAERQSLHGVLAIQLAQALLNSHEGHATQSRLHTNMTC